MKNKKKQAEKKEPSFYPFIIAIIILIIFILFLLFILNRISNPIKSMDDFCKEKGFEKKTDSIEQFHKVKYFTYIECDKDKIFITEKIEECEGEDKWGRCIVKTYTYREIDLLTLYAIN